MPRTLLLGPILNRNRESIVQQCKEMLTAGRGHEFLYLAATRPLLDRISHELLDGLPGVLAPPNVFLLSGFSRRLVREARVEATGEPLPFHASIDGDQRPVQRPLVARIVAHLSSENALPAFAPLARTDGLVDALVNLIAEIQRAGMSAAEFRDAIGRHADQLREGNPSLSVLPLSRDFDADAAAVYERFESILASNRLTDGNTDYLRALAVVRGDVDGNPVTVPFLDDVKLLVLDGFFDLLPVHQELVVSLIGRIDTVIVNLNHDESNPHAFKAHADVIERFEGMAGFEVLRSNETQPVPVDLAQLRRRLFSDEDSDIVIDGGVAPAESIVELVAPDRAREIRGIAKAIKQMAIDDDVALNRIAIVLAQRDRYEHLLREVFREEGIPLASGERRAVTDLPAVRAAMKVLDAAVSNRTPTDKAIGVRHLVALAKSDYFDVAPSPATSDSSTKRPAGEAPMQAILPFDVEPAGQPRLFSADELENLAAHVGIDLNLGAWLDRAAYLIAQDVLATSGAEKLPVSDFDELVSREEASAIEESDNDEETMDPTPLSGSLRKRPRLDVPVSSLRRAVGSMTALGEAVLRIPQRASAAEMASQFRAALDELGFRRRLVELARQSAGSREALLLAAVDLRGAESLDRAIDAVVEAVRLVTPSDDSIGRAEFKSDLERALAGSGTTLTADVPGGVRMLGLTDTRGLTFDVVFVPGLVEGELPERARSDWIYPQSERANYRNLGVPLEDISPEKLLEYEEHAFYQAVCRATHRLYLCRPETTDESETCASPFLEDVRLAVGDIPQESAAAGLGPGTLSGVTTKAELARGIIDAESRDNGGEGQQQLVATLANVARSGPAPAIPPDVDRRIAIERRRERFGFDGFDGLLARPDARGLVRDAYARRQFNATNLREYGTCAFQFFAHDVLGLEARTDAALDLQQLDTGNLAHEVLQRFYSLHARTDLTATPRDALVAALRACVDEVLDGFEQRMPPLNAAVWRIERRTLGMKLERFLDAEIALQARLAEHRAVARRVEVAFGVGRRDGDPDSVATALELEAGDRKIHIVGRIDRIDQSQDGSIVAYDYKTGRGAQLKAMREGRDYQLGIYVEALESLFSRPGESIAGGAYLTLGDEQNRLTSVFASADTPLGNAIWGAKRNKLSAEQFRELRQQIVGNIRNAVERIADGDFRVAPSGSMSPCKHCNYSSVCRVERYRIGRKLHKDGVNGVLPLPLPVREVVS